MMYESVLESIIVGFYKGAVISLANFWYVWLTLLVLILISNAIRLWYFLTIIKAGLSQIDKMTGEEFEVFIKDLFTKFGYKVEVVGHKGDFGADLLMEKNGIRTIVQAKRWKKAVNPSAIQQIFTAKAHYNATKAMVVTNNSYTSQAKKLAKENKVLLIDRRLLADLILKSKEINI